MTAWARRTRVFAVEKCSARAIAHPTKQLFPMQQN
jgi:hypothetical protein